MLATKLKRSSIFFLWCWLNNRCITVCMYLFVCLTCLSQKICSPLRTCHQNIVPSQNFTGSNIQISNLMCSSKKLNRLDIFFFPKPFHSILLPITFGSYLKFINITKTTEEPFWWHDKLNYSGIILVNLTG